MHGDDPSARAGLGRQAACLMSETAQWQLGLALGIVVIAVAAVIVIVIVMLAAANRRAGQDLRWRRSTWCASRRTRSPASDGSTTPACGSCMRHGRCARWRSGK